jgi:hypothetical protein
MRVRCVSMTARALFAALVVAVLWTPGPALAATKHIQLSAKLPFAYDTAGEVDVGADPASVNGSAVLKFQGIPSAMFDPRTGQTINLGQFVVAPASIVAGQTTTYTDTPFNVEIQTPEFNKTSQVALLDKLFPTLGKSLDLKTEIVNSLLIKGHLDGTVNANGQADVTATIDSIRLGSLAHETRDQVTHYEFPIRFSQLKLPSSWEMGTSVTTPSNTVSAAVVAPAPAAEMITVATPTPTPEPSTIVFFATALAGLVIGRKRLMNR